MRISPEGKHTSTRDLIAVNKSSSRNSIIQFDEEMYNEAMKVGGRWLFRWTRRGTIDPRSVQGTKRENKIASTETAFDLEPFDWIRLGFASCGPGTLTDWPVMTPLLKKNSLSTLENVTDGWVRRSKPVRIFFPRPSQFQIKKRKQTKIPIDWTGDPNRLAGGDVIAKKTANEQTRTSLVIEYGDQIRLEFSSNGHHNSCWSQSKNEQMGDPDYSDQGSSPTGR